VSCLSKHELRELLTYIINNSFETGSFPNKLKIAKVLPIYKKDNESLLENYRPISVLPTISKVIEKAICNQLHQYFKENNLYFNSQYGFRESHSTENAVLEVIDRVIFSMDEGKLPLNVFMDLSKAFDTIDHAIDASILKITLTLASNHSCRACHVTHPMHSRLATCVTQFLRSDKQMHPGYAFY
jgi:hypothetical protein